MPQIRLTDQERIQALERWGYSEREARFLCLAALHSGYFLRRQYGEFVGKSTGGAAATLIEKVLAKGHAKGTTYATNTHIYHLCARPFYAALGQEDNRNRRLRQPATIKNKLMGLDFVLTHASHDYLVTEQEKVAFFTGVLGLDRGLLPVKRYASQASSNERYFIEKFPIFLSRPTSAALSPVVSFCFVDEGLASVSAFATFLQHYSALLASVRTFQIIYVAATREPFDRAASVFERFSGHVLGTDGAAVGPIPVARVLEHFEMRHHYETQQWASFDRAKLIRFRDERKEFSDERFEALYRTWKTGGAAAVVAVLTAPRASLTAPQGTFLTCQLEQNYGVFGDTTA